MKIMAVSVVQNYRKQNFGAKTLPVEELIKELRVVEASDNVSAAAMDLASKLEGNLLSITEAIKTYFPQSCQLKAAFGIPHKIHSHPRHGI